MNEMTETKDVEIEMGPFESYINSNTNHIDLKKNKNN